MENVAAAGRSLDYARDDTGVCRLYYPMKQRGRFFSSGWRRNGKNRPPVSRKPDDRMKLKEGTENESVESYR